MEFRTYPDREMLMIDLADRIASELRAALAQNGRATLSVPGGTTPGPIFDILSGLDLDWANVAVMLNDERWVPEDSPRSNTRLLRERLLRDKAAAATLVPLYADAPRPEDPLDALAPILLPVRAEAAGEPRITLSAPVLRDAMNIHILITGSEKRAALERAEHLPETEAPVRAVLKSATIHWAD